MNYPTNAHEAKERDFRLADVMGIETSGIWSNFLTNWEVLCRVRGGESEPTRDLKLRLRQGSQEGDQDPGSHRPWEGRRGQEGRRELGGPRGSILI
jgi:hypothetical protein